MAKILNWRLVEVPDSKYIHNDFKVEEVSTDITTASGLINITAGDSIVLWNNTIADQYVPIYKGLGTKLTLKSNEFVVITTASANETLYYLAAADDANIYCNTEAAFVAAGGVVEGVTESPAQI